MTRIEACKNDAEYAFGQLLESIEGIGEARSWAVLPQLGEDYLHTDGSIHGIVLHIASTKWMYGGIAFRNTEIRWRQVADQIQTFEPSWSAAVDYIKRGHDYWTSTWSDLTDSDLDRLVPTNYRGDLPAWKLIQIVTHHDTYHAGQVNVIRYATVGTLAQPPSVAEDIRKYCSDSKHW